MSTQLRTSAGRIALTPSTPGAPPRSAPGLVPIVLGVTGHRDLCADDLPRLESAVRALFARLQHDYPNSPLVLVTPLAEGADRLVARVAIAMGAELVVPLPFAREEYEKDFPASTAEFDELFSHPRTARWFEMPSLQFGAPQDGIPAETRRALQYALVGAYVARHSQILIALWDGTESDSIGGTAHIVRYRRTGHFTLDATLTDVLERLGDPFGPSDAPLDPHDTGPIYQVITPRANRASPDNPFAGRWLVPEHAIAAAREDDSIPDALAKTLARIDVFNADALALAVHDAARIESSEQQLYDIVHAAVPPELHGLRRAFALADRLALRYQRETYRVLWTLYGLAFVALLCFEVYAYLFPPDNPHVAAVLAAYLGVLGIADLVYLRSKRRQSQSKFQDYRAVAEGLRVQFYWRLAGLPHSAADYYLRKQKGELSWIRDAIRAWSVSTAPERPGDMTALAKRWIDDQRAYFDRATRRERSRLRKHRSIAAGVIFASIIWALPTVAVSLSRLPHMRFNWLNVFQIPLLVVSVVLAWHIALKGSLLLRQRRGRANDASSAAAGEAHAAAVEARAFLVSTALGLIFMLGMARMPTWAHARWPLLPSASHPWIVVALTIITALGALVHAYTEKRAFGEHAHQYARMADIFTRASERMAALLHDGKLERAGILAIELGKEALAEHGDWVMLHRERAVELPRVGV